MTTPAGTSTKRGRAGVATTSAAVEFSATEGPFFADGISELVRRAEGQAEQDHRSELDKFFFKYMRGMAERIRDLYDDSQNGQ